MFNLYDDVGVVTAVDSDGNVRIFMLQDQNEIFTILPLENAQLGQWFIRFGFDNFDLIDPVAQTRVRNKIVEIRVPAVLPTDFSNFSVKIDETETRIAFSPIIHKIGVFSGYDEVEKDTLQYFWIGVPRCTPANKDILENYKKNYQIKWFLSPKEPKFEEISKKDLSEAKIFSQENGFVLAKNVDACLIWSYTIGLCMTKDENLHIGDGVRFIPIKMHYSNRMEKCLAVNCRKIVLPEKVVFTENVPYYEKTIKLLLHNKRFILLIGPGGRVIKNFTKMTNTTCFIDKYDKENFIFVNICGLKMEYCINALKEILKLIEDNDFFYFRNHLDIVVPKYFLDHITDSGQFLIHDKLGLAHEDIFINHHCDFPDALEKLESEVILGIPGDMKQIYQTVKKLAYVQQEFEENFEKRNIITNFTPTVEQIQSSTYDIPGFGQFKDRKRLARNLSYANKNIAVRLSYYIPPDFSNIFWNFASVLNSPNYMDAPKQAIKNKINGEKTNWKNGKNFNSTSENFTTEAIAMMKKGDEIHFFAPFDEARRYFLVNIFSLSSHVLIGTGKWYKINGAVTGKNKHVTHVRILKVDETSELIPTYFENNLFDENKILTIRKHNICISYVSGGCTRPDCRFKHSLINGLQMNDKPTTCLQFLNGFCKHGTECKFDHPIASLRTMINIQEMTEFGYFCRSGQLRGVLDTKNLLYKRQVGQNVDVWCSFLPKPIEGVFWQVEYVEENKEESKVEKISSNYNHEISPSTSSENFSTQSKVVEKSEANYGETGLVISEIENGFVVYSPCLSKEILLPNEKIAPKSFHLGQWIEFSANDNIILSYKEIEEKFQTMPFMNSVLVKCKILVPTDYTPKKYEATVSSQFFPKVCDSNGLITKSCVGKFLDAVIKYAPDNNFLPEVPWTITYVYYH